VTARTWWNTCAVKSKNSRLSAVSRLIGTVSDRMRKLGYCAQGAWARWLIPALIRGSVTLLTTAQKCASAALPTQVPSTPIAGSTGRICTLLKHSAAARRLASRGMTDPRRTNSASTTLHRAGGRVGQRQVQLKKANTSPAPKPPKKLSTCACSSSTSDSVILAPPTST